MVFIDPNECKLKPIGNACPNEHRPIRQSFGRKNRKRSFVGCFYRHRCAICLLDFKYGRYEFIDIELLFIRSNRPLKCCTFLSSFFVFCFEGDRVSLTNDRFDIFTRKTDKHSPIVFMPSRGFIIYRSSSLAKHNGLLVKRTLFVAL